MQSNLIVATRPAAPEDVLAVFKDQYRFQLKFDPEAEPDYEIDFALTVRDWTNACDLIRPSRLGPALGAEFGVEATRNDWLQVLKPVKKRTLKEVCEFISSRGGRVPVAKSYRIFGTRCRTAGAFLAIRAMLNEAGIDVRGLRPSCSVNEFIKNNNRHSALLNSMCRLAPGVLPDAVQRKENRTVDGVAAFAFLGGLLLILLGMLFAFGSWLSECFGGPAFANDLPLWTASISVFLLISGVLGFLAHTTIWPAEHSHPPMESFGDLARAIAAYEPPASSE